MKLTILCPNVFQVTEATWAKIMLNTNPKTLVLPEHQDKWNFTVGTMDAPYKALRTGSFETEHPTPDETDVDLWANVHKLEFPDETLRKWLDEGGDIPARDATQTCNAPDEEVMACESE